MSTARAVYQLARLVVLLAGRLGDERVAREASEVMAEFAEFPAA